MKLPTLFTVFSTALALTFAGNPASALDKEALRKAISGPDREVIDYVRDDSRKPVEVLDYLGLEPGMSVLDVYAAGGYFTFILSKAVGPEGIVYAQNTPRGLRFEEDRQEISQGEALNMKIERGNLTNVRHLVQSMNDIEIAPESLDMVMISQILHDYYNGSPERAVELLLKAKSLLKPGGIIAVIDHEGSENLENRRFHRMLKSQAIEVAGLAGLQLVGDSDLLHNPNDRHVRSIFDPMLNRNTDQFLLKLQKP